MLHVLLLLPLLLLLVGHIQEMGAVTVVAAICRNGLVLACDSLPTGGGALVQSRSVRHIHLLSDSIAVASVSPSAAQFNDFYDALRDQLLRQRLISGRDLSIDSVAHFARRLARQRFPALQVVLAGVTDSTGTDNVASSEVNSNDTNSKVNRGRQWRLFEIAPGGSLVGGQSFLAAGTGCELALSLLDNHHCHHDSDSDSDSDGDGSGWTSMDVEAAAPLVQAALSSAVKYDAFSGGTARGGGLWLLTGRRWRRVT
jgi:20S proteasome alpha/beta subunit